MNILLLNVYVVNKGIHAKHNMLIYVTKLYINIISFTTGTEESTTIVLISYAKQTKS